MKWLLILTGAVLALLIAWFFFGRSGAPELRGDYLVLEIPAATVGKPEVVRAAQQFLRYDPRRISISDGCLLLRILLERLEDGEWPSVQAAAFRGWNGLQSRPGSREFLERDLEKVLARFAQFGSLSEIRTLVHEMHSDPYWKTQADQALSNVVSREVQTGAPGPERVMTILEAIVAERDFDRASGYVSKVRWAEGVPDAVRGPVVKLERALRLRSSGLTTGIHGNEVVAAWGESPEDKLSAPIILTLGIDLARAEQLTLDFSPLRRLVVESHDVPRAAEFWEAVLSSFVSQLPDRGTYIEAPALDGLVGSYADVFQKSAFVALIWKRLADKAKGQSTGEGMWRVECLKRAFHASQGDVEKLVLLKEIAAGYATHMPGAAAKGLRPLVDELGGDARMRPDVLAMLDNAQKLEVGHQAAIDKANQEIAVAPLENRRKWLKQQLALAKTNQGTPELIRKLEQQIHDLDKKLPE